MRDQILEFLVIYDSSLKQLDKLDHPMSTDHSLTMQVVSLSHLLTSAPSEMGVILLVTKLFINISTVPDSITPHIRDHTVIILILKPPRELFITMYLPCGTVFRLKYASE